jgi:putative ABC transport system ATP-binding protein
MTDQPAQTIIAIRGLRRHFGGLRPLRIDGLTLRAGERVALTGLDAPAAEILTGLLTGAILPDEGEIRIFDRPTTDITDGQAWLEWLERFGIVSARGVLLSGSTVTQNLALPFTLSIEAIPADVLARVGALASSVGLEPDVLARAAGEAPPAVQARIHLARALALDPDILLLEHPTAMLSPEAVSDFGDDLRTVAAAHGLSMLVVTEDLAFAKRVADRRLILDPGSGALSEARSRWWRRH